MSTLDIIIIVVLGFGAVKGYMRGFVVEFFSFIAFFLGLFLALELTVPVAKWLFQNSSSNEILSILVFIALFILLSLAIKAGAKILKGVIDTTFFGALDNYIGAVAGIVKWIFLTSIFFWVVKSVGFDSIERYGEDAIILPYIVEVGPQIFGWLSEILPFIQDLIDSLENISADNNDLVKNVVNVFNGFEEKA